MLTDDGQRFAVFSSKLGEGVLPALLAADQPNSPPRLRHALHVIGGCVNSDLGDAGPAPAA